jgi:DNA-binding IclR family transcriptional regulator
VRAIAVLVPDAPGLPPSAVAVQGPALRLTDDRLAAVGDELRAAVA